MTKRRNFTDPLKAKVALGSRQRLIAKMDLNMAQPSEPELMRRHHIGAEPVLVSGRHHGLRDTQGAEQGHLSRRNQRRLLGAACAQGLNDIL